MTSQGDEISPGGWGRVRNFIIIISDQIWRVEGAGYTLSRVLAETGFYKEVLTQIDLG